MSYQFRTTAAFRGALARLSPSQRISAKKAFALFRQNPFDPRLRTHKIHRLSSTYKKTIYAVRVEGDLRSLFYVEGEIVVSVAIGTHAIYES